MSSLRLRLHYQEHLAAFWKQEHDFLQAGIQVANAGSGIAARILSTKEKLSRYEEANHEVLVDFDGTLSQWAYPDFGEPTEGAREAMMALRNLGYRIVIWTARMDRSIYPIEERLATAQDIAAWCDDHLIAFDEIDIGERGKRVAAFCIDDKNILFRGDWAEVLTHARVLAELNAERHKDTEGVYGDDVVRGDRPRPWGDRSVPPAGGWEFGNGDDVESGTS